MKTYGNETIRIQVEVLAKGKREGHSEKIFEIPVKMLRHLDPEKIGADLLEMITEAADLFEARNAEDQANS